jgi:hypothetical protein
VHALNKRRGQPLQNNGPNLGLRKNSFSRSRCVLSLSVLPHCVQQKRFAQQVLDIAPSVKDFVQQHCDGALCVVGMTLLAADDAALDIAHNIRSDRKDVEIRSRIEFCTITFSFKGPLILDRVMMKDIPLPALRTTWQCSVVCAVRVPSVNAVRDAPRVQKVRGRSSAARRHTHRHGSAVPYAIRSVIRACTLQQTALFHRGNSREDLSKT